MAAKKTPPTPAGTRQLVNVPRLAVLLGISEWSVYRLTADGSIPSHRIGHALRYDVDEVLAATRTGVGP